MKQIKLKEAAYFSDARTKNINLSTYITTDNMLPNIGGICDAEAVPDSKTLPKYETGDILISNIRPYFRKIWLANREGCCSPDVLVIKNLKDFDNKFIYYMLSDFNFFNYDYLTSKDTKMPRGIPNAIMKYKLPDVNIDIQRKIGNFLYRYDELIENNKKEIVSLENIAKELFNEWFIRFRHVSFKTIPFKKTKFGKIPNSVNIGKISEYINYYIGGGWGEDDESSEYNEPAFVIRGTDFNLVSQGNVSSCPHRYHKHSNYISRVLQENDIILEISGGAEDQPVGRSLLVSKSILDQMDHRVICASFCKLVRLNKEIISPYYFFYWMQYLYDSRVIDIYQIQSTGISNFQFEYFIRKGFLLVPPKELMDEFDKKIKEIRKKIDVLSQINTYLANQRNLFIPRISSGKINFSGKEIK